MMQLMLNRTRSGFTLLEVSLVIGILSLMLTMALLTTFNAITQTSLRQADDILVQMARRAQTLSQNNVNGSQWGVYICPGETVPSECSTETGSSIILFEVEDPNTTYEDRSSDLEFEINPEITFSGSLIDKMLTGPPYTGLVFKRFTGEPLNSRFSGAIIMTRDPDQFTISVNGQGVFEH